MRRPNLNTCVAAVVIFFHWSPVFGQFYSAGQVDSLMQQYRSLETYEEIDRLNELGCHLAIEDPGKLQPLFNEVLTLCGELRYDRGKAQALIHRGTFEWFSGKMAPARKSFLEGIELAEKTRDHHIKAYGMLQLASPLLAIGRNDSAAILFDQAWHTLKDSLEPEKLSLLYRKWSQYYSATSNFDREINLLQRSLAISEATGDASQISESLLAMASSSTRRADYGGASRYLDRVSNYLAPIHPKNRRHYALIFEKAHLLSKQAKYDEALNYFNDIKTFYRTRATKLEYARVLIQIGYIMTDLGNFEVSLNNFYEALALCEEQNFWLEKAQVNWQIGWAFYELKEDRYAFQYARTCLRESLMNGYQVEEATALNLLGLLHHGQGDSDSALHYLDRALAIRQNLGNPTRIASTLNNIGDVMETMGKFPEAIAYQTKSLALEEKAGNNLGKAWTLCALGRLHFRQGNKLKAKRDLDDAEKAALEINASQVLAEIYGYKADVLKAERKFEDALMYAGKAGKLKDEIYKGALVNRMASLQTQYHMVQKSNEIELLNKDKTIQDGRIRQQRIYTLVGFGGFITALLISTMLFRNYKRVKRLSYDIYEKNEEIQTQAEELQESNNQLTELNHRLTESKEEINMQAEKLRSSNEIIARINEGLEVMVEKRTSELKQAYKELDTFFYRTSHDFRRPLTTFMGLAEVARITIKDPVALELFEKVDLTARNLDKMLIKLQSISDLGTQQLVCREVFIRELIENILDSFREEIQRNQIRIELDFQLNESIFSYPVMLRIIIENLIENAISFASLNDPTVQIRVISQKAGVTIEIEDNGEGIDKKYQPFVFDMYFRASDRSRGNGLGLYIVKKVVDRLKGSVDLHSAPGQGTSIRVNVPGRQAFQEFLRNNSL